MTTEKKSAEINTIVIQPRTLLDTIAARYFLLTSVKGEDYFPGIRKAQTVFWMDEQAPDGLDPRNWREDKRLYLGRGGDVSPFDEHPGGEKRTSRLKDECTTMLVAKYLGIDQNLTCAPVLEAILKEDEEANSGTYAMPVAIKLWHPRNNNPWPVIRWAEQGLEALLADDSHIKFRDSRERLSIYNILRVLDSQNRGNPRIVAEWLNFVSSIYTEAQASFDAAVKDVKAGRSAGRIEFREIEHSGKRLKVVSCRSGSPDISRAIRFCHPDTAVTVVKRSDRSVHILPNAKYKINMPEVAAAIRYYEQIRRGHIETRDWRVLRQEGEVPGAENWAFPFKSMLLNRSHTCPGAPVTLISLETIVEIVCDALDDFRFEPARAEKCKKGHCPSSRDNPCSWFYVNFRKCSDIRKSRSQKNQCRSSAQRRMV